MTDQQIDAFRRWEYETSALAMALSIISFDQETVAPTAGAGYRDRRTSWLAGEFFAKQTDPANLANLRQLSRRTDLDEADARSVQLHLRDIDRILAIPKDDFVAYNQLQNECFASWRKARQADDYRLFEPSLTKIIAAAARMVGYRQSDCCAYDRMLDDYETGMDIKRYDAFFTQVRERLVPLIQKVGRAVPIDDSFLHQVFPVAQQKEYMKNILRYLGFDASWGYQGESEHPFTTWMCIDDVRTTTRYLPDDPVSAILSTVHEVGHGFYAHDCDRRYDGTIIHDDITSGLHESQSRLAENYLGRSPAFWQANYPALQQAFPQQLGEVSLQRFVRAINVSRPSLIRTEADELTYPLHIMIRYEIEKGLFDGSISTSGLDRTWDDMYMRYLGVKAPSARSGILQDIHWSQGSFGYFPTYALGSAYAAQFYHRMRQDIDVDACLSQGRYADIVAWLTQHIHRFGALYDPDELIVKATGEPFNPGYYFDYLQDKFSRLYGL